MCVTNKSEKVKNKKGKSHKQYMLPPRGRATAGLVAMLLDLSIELADIINRAHFGVDGSRSSGEGVGQSWSVFIGLIGWFND